MPIKNFGELAVSDLHRLALELAEHGLAVADPYNAVRSSVSLDGKRILVGGEVIEAEGQIHVIGFGKASKRMAMALNDLLGDRIVGGVVITPDEIGYIGNIKLVRGNHPIPGKDTLNSSQLLLDYVSSNVSENDIVFVVISGGGSALFEVPEDGISLDDIAWISRELMRRGADIFELNAVRKRFSKVKGGKLLRFLKAKKVVSLIISDVIGDRLDTIASGPTAPDDTTFRDVYNILKRRGVWGYMKDSMKRIVELGLEGIIADTPKRGDNIFNKVFNIIIASNKMVLDAMAEKARGQGFNTLILTSMLEGEAREVGKVLASVMRSIDVYGMPLKRPVAILAGGETVVTVRGNGIGGRNQELCLSLSISIRGMNNVVALCMGTDGIDGISPAAGAIVDGKTYYEGLEQGLDPQECLENNDSYTYFSKLRRAIITGYTGTNVNDIFIALMK
ncbi:MAG: glycerate kinase [Ignisphaera sp.]